MSPVYFVTCRRALMIEPGGATSSDDYAGAMLDRTVRNKLRGQVHLEYPAVLPMRRRTPVRRHRSLPLDRTQVLRPLHSSGAAGWRAIPYVDPAPLGPARGLSSWLRRDRRVQSLRDFDAPAQNLPARLIGSLFLTQLKTFKPAHSLAINLYQFNFGRQVFCANSPNMQTVACRHMNPKRALPTSGSAAIANDPATASIWRSIEQALVRK